MAGDTRLRYQLRSQGAVWAHLDASRSHVLIDPRAEIRAREPGFVRPIELWRASRWKRPPSVNVVRYPEAGGLDVKEADQPPGSGETVNLSAVVDFISDLAGSRLGALGGLIDAVAAALDGGPPVVLAAPNADQGALWIGAVSFFTPPAVSLRLSFSTHERWDDVIAQRLRDGSADLDAEGEGWHTPVLSVVPQADVDRLTRREDPPVVVIDPRVETVFTVVDGVAYRQTHLGQRIRVTEWSGRALAACCADYAVLERRVRDFHSTGPDAPPNGSRTDTELAWERLQTGEPAGSGERSAFEAYLRLALDDDSWLLRRAPPLPIAPPVEDDLPARLREPLIRLTHRLTNDLPPDDDPFADVRHGLLLLRALDFAARIARAIGGPDVDRVGVSRLGARAAEVLLDPVAGARVAEIVGPLDGAALARWVVPVLSADTEPWLTSANPVGKRLPAPVIALLAQAVDPGKLAASTRADPLAAGPVALEVAVASASGRIAGDPLLRGPAVEYLLHQAARAYPDADPGPMVAEVFDRLVGDDPWPAELLLALVERAPAALGAELVPIVLRRLPDWVDDPLSARLAAVLLKRIQFLPNLSADGRRRPRRAGTTDDQAQLLNLLAATGPGWLHQDDGLHRRAAEILMWADHAWNGSDEQVQRLIAARITVAAFQVALAAEADQVRSQLQARLKVVPLGSSWRSAVTIGLEPALGMLAEILRLNRFRLAGELVVATTRAQLNPHPEPLAEDRPRLATLPVGPVIHWLVEHEGLPELKDHLAALVEQELRGHPEAAERVRAFWEQALPDVPIRVDDPDATALPEPVLDEVLQVALGFRDRAGRPIRSGGLAGLLGHSPVTRHRSPAEPEPAPPDPAEPTAPDRPRWWRRWVDQLWTSP